MVQLTSSSAKGHINSCSHSTQCAVIQSSLHLLQYELREFRVGVVDSFVQLTKAVLNNSIKLIHTINPTICSFPHLHHWFHPMWLLSTDSIQRINELTNLTVVFFYTLVTSKTTLTLCHRNIFSSFLITLHYPTLKHWSIS